MESSKQAKAFLSIATDFKLGELSTEKQHPKTVQLSKLTQKDLPSAIELLRKIDLDMLKVLAKKQTDLAKLASAINKTFKQGGSVYLCGCGATGRLSLVLETLWRADKKHSPQSQVISFMAGGDVALISSIEKFEDYPQYGAQQLMDLGFSRQDLLISCTEGGETPFVIGATEAASEISNISPFFLYCNPDDLLSQTVERSKKVIENRNIEKINLDVGPMALSGSTRMQASTILMFAVGLGLWNHARERADFIAEIEQLTQIFKDLDLSFLEPFILEESDIYQRGEFLIYETDENLGISILTDTTERSPTFSLLPFENQNDQTRLPSLSHLFFPQHSTSQLAWEKLLGRKPRTLDWSEVKSVAGEERLYGFDFSHQLLKHRKEYCKKAQHFFKIYQTDNGINFTLNSHQHHLKLKNSTILQRHLILKMLLNSLSTIIMGRLNRYEQNMMTWVRASNNKLIDRAIRYTTTLLNSRGIDKSYREICQELFRVKNTLTDDQAIVLAMVENLSKNN